MTIISIPFFIFFITSILVYYTVSEKYRNIVLLIFSALFISFFSVGFLLYAVSLSFINYYTGLLIYNLKGRRKKLIYYIGQSFNIGGLIFFKYINFLFEILNNIIPNQWNFSIPYLNILIPVGISYYTFQGVSYLYLIYKANDKPERKIVNFMLYMLFFPKILAGPIERHRIFLPQLSQRKEFSGYDISAGVRLFFWGALKKVMIADVLYVIVKTGIRNPELSGIKLLIVFSILPVYMYADFSGYTDMARGMGRMFGYRLSINFNYPLFSKSVSEFWRRWHISLSSWCNDFIFVRLLLKHKKWGNMSFVYAIFVTFIIVGLWHGAGVNFVVLGLLQAVAITFEFLTNKRRRKFFADKNKLFIHVLSSAFVYLFFAVTLTFFFLPTLPDAIAFLSGIFENWSDLSLVGFDIEEVETGISLLFIVMLFIIELTAYSRAVNIEKLLPSNIILRNILYITALVFVIYYSKYQNVFVYENF